MTIIISNYITTIYIMQWYRAGVIVISEALLLWAFTFLNLVSGLFPYISIFLIQRIFSLLVIFCLLLNTIIIQKKGEKPCKVDSLHNIPTYVNFYLKEPEQTKQTHTFVAISRTHRPVAQRKVLRKKIRCNLRGCSTNEM